MGRNGAERVRMHGHEGNLDNILHRTESSYWVADVIGDIEPLFSFEVFFDHGMWWYISITTC